MKITSKKGSNKITFTLTEKSFENKIKAIDKYKGLLPARKINRKDKKILGVTITYKWGYSKKAKTKTYEKEYTDKERANEVYRMGIISDVTNKKNVRGEDFTWHLYKGKTKYKIVAIKRDERPSYYYNGIKFPFGAKLTQKTLMKFISADIQEKYEYYAYEREYDKVHNLRSVTLNFIYENPSQTT